MPEWFRELLLGPLVHIGQLFWGGCMTLTNQIIGITPMEISSGVLWEFISQQMYPFFLVLGSSLMGVLFLVGFIRQAAGLRHNLTIEILIMQALKLFLSESLLLNGLPLMRELFIFAGALAWTGGGIFFPSIPTPEEISIGTILLYWVLGLFYCLAAIVGGFVILFTVYKRYINLFVLVIFCPVAIAWLPGDVHTTLAWVKSFLGSVFEIVVIAWVLALVSLMLNNGAIVFSSLEGTPAEPFVAMLEGMLMMLISSGCVKGAESLLRRSFHL